MDDFIICEWIPVCSTCLLHLNFLPTNSYQICSTLLAFSLFFLVYQFFFFAFLVLSCFMSVLFAKWIVGCLVQWMVVFFTFDSSCCSNKHIPSVCVKWVLPFVFLFIHIKIYFAWLVGWLAGLDIYLIVVWLVGWMDGVDCCSGFLKRS